MCVLSESALVNKSPIGCQWWADLMIEPWVDMINIYIVNRRSDMQGCHSCSHSAELKLTRLLQTCAGSTADTNGLYTLCLCLPILLYKLCWKRAQPAHSQLQHLLWSYVSQWQMSWRDKPWTETWSLLRLCCSAVTHGLKLEVCSEPQTLLQCSHTLNFESSC